MFHKWAFFCPEKRIFLQFFAGIAQFFFIPIIAAVITTAVYSYHNGQKLFFFCPFLFHIYFIRTHFQAPCYPVRLLF